MARTRFRGPIVSANGFTGAVTGAVTGNITGNVTGDVVGNLTGNVTGNASGTAASITGALTGDVTSSAMATTLALVNGVSATIAANASRGIFDIATAANIETSSGTSGALSVTKLYSAIDSTAGAGSRTLAAPAAGCRLKVIEMTVDNGDTTLALTNVVGGSAGSTATFDDIGDYLILLSVGAKWVVLGNTAVLS